MTAPGLFGSLVPGTLLSTSAASRPQHRSTPPAPGHPHRPRGGRGQEPCAGDRTEPVARAVRADRPGVGRRSEGRRPQGDHADAAAAHVARGRRHRPDVVEQARRAAGAGAARDPQPGSAALAAARVLSGRKDLRSRRQATWSCCRARSPTCACRNGPPRSRSFTPTRSPTSSRWSGNQQVQLEVKFAEVSRTGLRALGLNFFHQDAGGRFVGGMTAPGSAAGRVLRGARAPGSRAAARRSAARGRWRVLAVLLGTAELPVQRDSDRAGNERPGQDARRADAGGAFRAGGEVPGRRRVPHPDVDGPGAVTVSGRSSASSSTSRPPSSPTGRCTSS